MKENKMTCKFFRSSYFSLRSEANQDRMLVHNDVLCVLLTVVKSSFSM